tara:strand:+ start:26365 stop:27804 length:1440 start_codon:yes stop_codon:yes gene_type:complete
MGNCSINFLRFAEIKKSQADLRNYWYGSKDLIIMDKSPHRNSRQQTLSLYGCLIYANEGLDILAPLVENQLNLFDETNITDDQKSNGEKKSLTYVIAEGMKKMNSNYLSSILTPGRLQVFLDDILSDNRYIISGNDIIPAKHEQSKQYDVVRTIYVDSDDPFLKIDDLYTMSDLEWLSNINAYQVCYSGCKLGRTRYEYFFGPLIEFLVKEDDTNYENMMFQVLQDTSPYLHLVSEYTISIIEMLIQLVAMTNSRIKTSPLTIRLDLRLNAIDHEIFTHASECFKDPNKIFHSFKTGKITRVESKSDLASLESISWTDKIEMAHSNMMTALDSYDMMVDLMLNEIVDLKSRLNNKDWKDEGLLEIHVAEVSILIIELQNFISTIRNSPSGYLKLFANMEKLLSILDELEKEYPMIYGEYTTTNPRTPRSQPRARQNVDTCRSNRSKSMDYSYRNESAENGIRKLDFRNVRFDYPDEQTP